MIKINLIFLFLIIQFISCSDKKFLHQNDINLELLNSFNDVFDAGKKLMALQKGLYELEPFNENQKILFIAVHGNSSRGYEWIYPLNVINVSTNLISFFRWNDGSCINSSVTVLDNVIKNKLKKYQNIKKVILFGHSYGGLLTVSFMDQWKSEIPLEIHTIAAPLRGLDRSIMNCSYTTPTNVPVNSYLYEWRTIHKLDGAFKHVEYDPQNVKIIGSKVKRLPSEYKGNNLGHNWSLSWVADYLIKKE
tara:strand:+ start:240 stop:983 length:744 start_codon:yes stop_codon:yes gene_type:complete